MNCPRCGYARSAFDKYCLRCRIMETESRARPSHFVNPAEQTVVMSDLVGSLPPPPRALSSAWVVALLAVLFLLAAFALSYVATPHSPQARLAPGSQMRASS